MRIASLVLMSLLVSCATPEPSSSERLPDDVQAFIDRRELCDHFRGEIPDPDDVGRMEEVSREIDRSCTSIDQELEGLKKKYVRSAGIRSMLNDYDAPIEAVVE